MYRKLWLTLYQAFCFLCSSVLTSLSEWMWWTYPSSKEVWNTGNVWESMRYLRLWAWGVCVLQMLRQLWSSYASISCGSFNSCDSTGLATVCPESRLKGLFLLCDWEVPAFSFFQPLSSVSFSGNRFKIKVIQGFINLV